MKYLIKLSFILAFGFGFSLNSYAQKDVTQNVSLTVEAWSNISLNPNSDLTLLVNTSGGAATATDNSTELSWGTNASTTSNIVVFSGATNNFDFTVTPGAITDEGTVIGNSGTSQGETAIVNGAGTNLITGISQGGGRSTLTYTLSATQYEAPKSENVVVTYRLQN